MKNLITHRNIYLFGLTLMVVSIPLSMFLMSISQFILVANWLIEGNFKTKLVEFSRNKAALLFTSVLVIHAIGFFYSSDTQFALKDLRIKLPLLVIPLIITTSPKIDDRLFRTILLFYIGAIVFGSFRSVYELIFNNVTDRREISVFISHIRFSLNICLAIIILVSFITLKSAFSKPFRAVMLATTLWLVGFLFILQAATGMGILITLAILSLINYSLLKSDRRKRIISISLALILLGLSAWYIKHIVKDVISPAVVSHINLPPVTARGNNYHHDTLNTQTVNGNRVWLYLCENELREEWNERSSLAYDDKDSRGQDIRDILIRYLTSKGYPKDADGISKLTASDIRLIEAGVPDMRYPRIDPLSRRAYEFIWEYQNYKCTGNPSGHSVLMRYEYWKAALGIISGNFWTGVGTGDLKESFLQQYEKNDSRLDPKWRLRAHNQFLSIFAAFGIFGFLWFIAAIVLPPVILKINRDYYFNFFLLISLMSMLTEDTLETQAGVTFFAFFYTFLLFARKNHFNAFMKQA